MRKRGLQILTGVLAAIPIFTGIIGKSDLRDPLYVSSCVPTNVLLDSNLRFFSGVWLGLGMAIYWIIPRIEQKLEPLSRPTWNAINPPAC